MKTRSSITVLILFVCAIAYVHGVRLADLSEMPSSQRPWSPYVSGEAN